MARQQRAGQLYYYNIEKYFIYNYRNSEIVPMDNN